MNAVRPLTAIVTGGASGLGRATVLRLADAGYGVVVADLLNSEPFEKDNIRFVRTDVTNEMEVNVALDIAREEFGPDPCVVVNCAGIGYAKRTLNRKGVVHDLDGFSRVLSVNAVGTFNVLRLAAQR
ncbi:unnamed protein product [Choristocarpus tenellus]